MPKSIESNHILPLSILTFSELIYTQLAKTRSIYDEVITSYHSVKVLIRMGYAINEKLIPFSKYTRPGKDINVKGVVIHWTANEAKGANAEMHYRYFSRSTRYASAHYFVDDKQILRIIPENEMAYHVGSRSYKTSKYGSYPNASMIGVEMCVNSDADFKETYKRSVWLVAHLLKKYGLGLDDLERHYDITGKNCPAMFTEKHWGKINNAYGQKYMGMNAEDAYRKFKKDVAEVMNPPAKPAPAKPTTDNSIGILEVLVPALNVRSDANFSASIVKTINKGEKYKVYGEKNGLYQVGKTQWTSANSKYVRYIPHPKPSPSPKSDVHVVQKGDNLWEISRTYGVSVQDIKEWNNMRSDVIQPGDALVVSKSHIVVKGDTLWGISRKYDISVDELKKLNGMTSNVINPGDVLKV